MTKAAARRAQWYRDRMVVLLYREAYQPRVRARGFVGTPRSRSGLVGLLPGFHRNPSLALRAGRSAHRTNPGRLRWSRLFPDAAFSGTRRPSPAMMIARSQDSFAPS